MTRVPGPSRRIAPLGALLAGALASALGCRDEKPAAVARAADTTSPEGHFAAPAIVPNDTSCVLSGLWRQCSVRERLERAGLAPQVGDTVRHAFLHVPGQRYRVGDAELQAFVYATTEMRQRDTAPLDSVRAAPPGTETVWERPPTLITAANLAAVLIGGNERQVERVTLALTAGTGTTDFQPAGAAKE